MISILNSSLFCFLFLNAAFGACQLMSVLGTVLDHSRTANKARENKTSCNNVRYNRIKNPASTPARHASLQTATQANGGSFTARWACECGRESHPSRSRAFL